MMQMKWCNVYMDMHALSLSSSYINIYTYMKGAIIEINIYIYIYRERERKR